jgi:hypothetical protein
VYASGGCEQSLRRRQHVHLLDESCPHGQLGSINRRPGHVHLWEGSLAERLDCEHLRITQGGRVGSISQGNFGGHKSNDAKVKGNGNVLLQKPQKHSRSIDQMASYL